MARLPQVGGDKGNWGDILNDYLSQSHADDGTLKTDTVGAAQLKPLAVTGAAIANDSVSEAKLNSAVRAKLNAAPTGIADGSVTTAKLADGAVTTAKLSGAAQANGIATLENDGKLFEAQVPARLGESALDAKFGPLETVFLDQFDRYLDGAFVAGSVPLIGDPWSVITGSALPQILDGALQGTGTGYAWFHAPGANFWDREISWAGTGVARTETIGVATTSGDLLNLFHLNVIPTGFVLSYRINGHWSGDAPSTALQSSGDWRTTMKADGTRYRVGLGLTMGGAVVFGPSGEQFSVVVPQLASKAWDYCFTEPTYGGTGTYPRIHALSAAVRPTVEGQGAGWLINSYGHAVGNRDQVGEVTIGRDPSSGAASITFGPRQLETTTSAASIIGATTLVTLDALLQGQTYVIDPDGLNQETFTSNGYSGGSSPHSRPVSALTEAHAVGEAILCLSVNADRRSSIYHDPAAPGFHLSQFIADGIIYLAGQTAYIQQSDAGVIAFGGVGAGKGAVKTGSGTTAQRPAIASVGNGAIWYDTTLSRYIYSDGTIWRRMSDDTAA